MSLLMPVRTVFEVGSDGSENLIVALFDWDY